MCNTNNCPSGVATQKPELRQRLNIDKSAEQLANFLGASVELIQVMARACGHNNIQQFSIEDIATWKREIALLSGIRYSGVADLR
jgi:glutamate synthase domain-containing protein 2